MALTHAEHDLEVETGRLPATAWRWWWVVLAGGVIGIGATVWQTVERIHWAAGDRGNSVCDISAVVSCSNVYSHWQSSALGIPNSLIGLPVFAFMASAALAALLGSRPARPFLLTAYGITLFMTAFVLWYLEQSALSIGALCLFCLGCFVSISLVGVGLTRVVDAEGALGAGAAGRRLRTLVDTWADLAIWAGLAFLVAAMLFVGLVL